MFIFSLLSILHFVFANHSPDEKIIRVSNSIAEYDFKRSECLINKFSDSSIHNTLGFLSKTDGCLNSNGIGNGSQVDSVYNISSLQSVVKQNPFTIEVWLQPQQRDGFSAILNMGSPQKSLVRDCVNNLMVRRTLNNTILKYRHIDAQFY